MKTNQNEKEAVAARAKEYVDAQLNTIRKFGQPAQISEDKYKKIVQKVARAAS